MVNPSFNLKAVVALLLLNLQLASCFPWLQSILNQYRTNPCEHNTKNLHVPYTAEDDDAVTVRPNRYESTVLARRLMAMSRTGIISTIFPSNITSSHIPKDMASLPIALPEYYASCEEPSGNPTLLMLNIAVSTQNAWAGSNVSLAISWWDQYAKLKGKDPWAVANLPRVSLIGYIEEMTKEEVSDHAIVSCYVKAHHDSILWLPGEKFAAHEGKWMRLVVQDAYWIGGFGDSNWIGWFDIDEWRKVTKEEWMDVKLPGEA